MKILASNDHNLGHFIGRSWKEDYPQTPITSYNTIFLFSLLVEEGSDHKLDKFKHLPYPSQRNPQLGAVYTVPMQCCVDWTASSKSNYHQLHFYQWSQIPHTNPELSLHRLHVLYHKCTLHEQVRRLKILQLCLLVLHLHLYWILFQWPKHIGRYIELILTKAGINIINYENLDVFS